MSRRSNVKKVLAVFAGMTVAGLVLSGCTGESAPPGPSSADKSELRLGSDFQLGGWDPALMTNGTSIEYQWRPVFDTLLVCDSEGGVFPGAAKEFELSEDSTTLKLTIRDGMTFDDGSPIDAGAVKASLDYMGSDKAVQASNLKGISAAVQGDDVILTSETPNSNLTKLMCGIQGIVISPEAIASATIGDAPVSSGPYSFDATKSSSGSVYTFTKRDDYWDTESYPYKSLTLTVLADPSARVSALTTGQVDGVALAPSSVEEAERSGLTVLRSKNLSYGVFLLDRAGEKVPALGDVRVRQAINMVFDRPAITKAIWGKEGTPTTQIFAPSTGGFDEGLDDAYELDVDKAKKLMAEAGFADGFDIELPLVANITEQAAPIIVQQLALLNIRVTEVPLTGPTAVAELFSGKFPLLYVAILTQPDSEVMLNYVNPDATWNPFHYTTPEMEALIAQTRAAQGNEADAAYQGVNKILVEDAWFAVWASIPSTFGINNPDLVPKRTDRYGFMPTLRDFK